jgi:hypothetical protein
MSDRFVLALVASIAIASLACVYVFLNRRLPGVLGVRFVWLQALVQAGALLAVAAIGVDTVPPGMVRFFVDIAHAPGRVALAQFANVGGLLIGAAAFAAIVKSLGGRRWMKRISRDPDLSSAAITICLTLIAVRPLLTHPSLGLFAYIIRIAAAPMDPAALLAGLHHGRTGRQSARHTTLLITGVILEALTGSRHGIVVAALYVLGYVGAFRGTQLFRRVALLSGFTVIGLAVAAIVGVVRSQLGRDNTDMLRADNVSTFIQLSIDTITSGDIGSHLRREGIARLFAWPNAVVAILTPDVIAYRGLEDIATEVRAHFRIWVGYID